MIVYPAYAYMGKKKPDLTKYAFYGYKDSYYSAPWVSLANGAEYAIDEGVYRLKLLSTGQRMDGANILGSKLVLLSKCASNITYQIPASISWKSASGSSLGTVAIPLAKEYQQVEMAVPAGAASFRIFRNDQTGDPVFLDQIHFE